MEVYSSPPSATSAGRAGPRRIGAVASPRGALSGLYALRPGEIWRFVKSQPAAFWLVNIYLFFEYVRPQQIYPSLAGPPWALMSIVLTLIAVLLGRESIGFPTIAGKLLLVFTSVVFLSSIAAISPAASFDNVWEGYFAWVLIFVMITNIINTEKRFLVFMLAFLLYSFKMAQHGTRAWMANGFAFQGDGVTGTPGWFHNSGEFGVQMAIFLAVSLYFIAGLRRHWGPKTRLLFYSMVLSAVISIIGSSSRGAMIAGAAVVLLLVVKTRQRFRALVLVAVLGLFALYMMPPEQVERFRSIGDDTTSNARTQYWAFGRKVIREYPVLGIGYHNWASYFQRHNGYKALPHNILIECTAELGYTGTTVFLALVGATLHVNRRTRKRLAAFPEEGQFLSSMAHGLDSAMVGFLIAGQFVTILYYPFFWINLAMTVSLHRAAEAKLRELEPVRAPIILRAAHMARVPAAIRAPASLPSSA